MYTLPAELLYVTRSLVESQLAGCNALMRSALDGGASLLDLNVRAARAHLDAANVASSELLFVRQPQDLLGLTARQSQSALDRAQAYGRQMAGVANDWHSRLDALGKARAGSAPHNPIE